MFTQVYFRAQEILGFLSGNKAAWIYRNWAFARSNHNRLLLRNGRGVEPIMRSRVQRLTLRN